jgi:triacylglycerol lipase
MHWSLVALLVAAAFVVAFVVWAYVRRRQQRARLPAKRAPRLRHPVVLAHGLLGFDEIAIAGRKTRYFRGLAGLEADFIHPRVQPTASIAVRAQRLADLIREVPGGRVNIIAHSMGGLDARYAIARLGLDQRVASLVTIGTPHRGTPLADAGSHLVPAAVTRALSKVMDVGALHDLTTVKMEQFNREVLDLPEIAYCSIVAKSSLAQTHPLLWPTHAYLSRKCDENDGIVCASSQRWGTVLREIDADHWAQIGWSGKFDAVELYGSILRELAALGF